jgi:mono/diheme cytochrome c family protein
LTEIPEHLLKRSKERRAAMGLGGGEEAASETPAAEPSAASSGGAASTPARTPAAAPAAAPAPPPPPKPVPPYVQASQRRKRIPIWAMPVLALLPLWAYVYAYSLSPPPAGENDPMVLGEQLYTANCASCHGPQGGGGVGPQLSGGVVLKSWPDFKDHMAWVARGSAKWGQPTYGADKRPVKGGMPSWEGTLTDQEIAQVVLYERVGLSGGQPDADLLAMASGEKPADVSGGEQAKGGGSSGSSSSGG